jgi:hypothetical protein
VRTYGKRNAASGGYASSFFYLQEKATDVMLSAVDF